MTNNIIKKIDKYMTTTGEEIANAVSHGVMATLALFLIPIATVIGYESKSYSGAACAAIFIISLFLMFLASTLYHSMAIDSEIKRVFRLFDHIFIFFAIAGSYTPIALFVIKGWQGIVMIVIQWSMVLFGILDKSISKHARKKASLMIYLIMGWTAVVFMPVLLKNANAGLLTTILLGGIFYSIGAVFYAKKGFKFHHFVWHMFINLGAITHVIGILVYLY